MKPLVAIAVGAAAGSALFASSAKGKGKQERLNLLVPGALVGGLMGFWTFRTVGGDPSQLGRVFGRRLSGLHDTYANIDQNGLGVVDWTSVIDAASSVASSGIQMGQQISAQKAIERAQAAQAKAAQQAAFNAERVARAQALSTSAEAQRLQAQGAASPLNSPAVVLSLVAVLGLGAILLLRRKPAAATNRSLK